MLTKLERKVLCICNKYPRTVVITDDIQKYAPKLSKFDIAECCERLGQNGYFEIYNKDLNGCVHLLLNYKGRHFREFSRNQVIDFLFKSVLVPIVVSIITTYLLSILL